MNDGKLDRKMIRAIRSHPRNRFIPYSKMSLTNNYSLRTAKDQRPCFICGKFSSSVLDAPDDFFFICLSHTKDSSFCSIITIPITPTGSNKVTADEESEIEKLKKEISDLKEQLNKKETKETEAKTEEKKLETTAPPVPVVNVYKLHRSFLFMREEEKSKKEKLNLLKSLK